MQDKVLVPFLLYDNNMGLLEVDTGHWTKI